MTGKPYWDIPQEELVELVDSFTAIKQTTQKLHSAYLKLEERFRELNHRLRRPIWN